MLTKRVALLDGSGTRSSTRRALFVEGKDFRLLSRFARKLGKIEVGNSKDVAVVAAKGFNPEKIRNMIEGMEATLGFRVVSAAILDRDFRSDDECSAVRQECLKHCDLVSIHRRKEIENFLLVPAAIERAASRRIARSVGQSAVEVSGSLGVEDALNKFAEEKKSYVASQLIESHKAFVRKTEPGKHPAEVTAAAYDFVESTWNNPELRTAVLPGKDALSAVNRHLQDNFGVSVSPSSIVEAMHVDEIFVEMRELIQMLVEFSNKLHRP